MTLELVELTVPRVAERYGEEWDWDEEGDDLPTSLAAYFALWDSRRELASGVGGRGALGRS